MTQYDIACGLMLAWCLLLCAAIFLDMKYGGG